MKIPWVLLLAVSLALRAEEPPIEVNPNRPTFATPALLRCFDFDADLVVESTTKYLSGHNQIIGGAVIVRMRMRLAASSIRSMALSGRKRSLM